ncbi:MULTISPECIES: hypothetical protein [unclassified Paenibacillus]|uniref:hypothetical protein n=1 Tax=unclassified Paenibacillus TaxID=185978 RepID=UPI000AA051D6|nr:MULTISPECIES: hypothetical protein [unclassified Paenibacillus]
MSSWIEEAVNKAVEAGLMEDKVEQIFDSKSEALRKYRNDCVKAELYGTYVFFKII